MSNTIIKIDNLYKRYKLGAIGGATLTADLQSWWAKIRHKEDPNVQIGKERYGKGGTFMALNGVSFEVKEGEAIGIIGGNGAGKSTLLKLLSRVTAPTDGTIEYYGRIASMLEVGTGFHPELTGRENIYMNGAILGMTRAEVDRKIEEIIDFSECRPFIDTPVKRYSSGMYVKLAFSVAAHLDSEIMIMDEVLAVGDVAFQDKCLAKMKELATGKGRTILYVSHNMNTIRTLCTRCVVMNSGQIVYDGDVEEGIQCYLQNNISEESVDIDLSERERPGSQTNDVKMMHFAYCDKASAVYHNTEKMKFNIDWISNNNLTGVMFKLIIRHISDIPVGVTYSDSFDVKKDTKHSHTLEFDLSNLAEGKYFASISIFQKDGFGRDLLLDHITRAISFVVENDDAEDNIIWQHRYWGSVKFNKLKIV